MSIEQKQTNSLSNYSLPHYFIRKTVMEELRYYIRGDGFVESCWNDNNAVRSIAEHDANKNDNFNKMFDFGNGSMLWNSSYHCRQLFARIEESGVGIWFVLFFCYSIKKVFESVSLFFFAAPNFSSEILWFFFAIIQFFVTVGNNFYTVERQRNVGVWAGPKFFAYFETNTRVSRGNDSIAKRYVRLSGYLADNPWQKMILDCAFLDPTRKPSTLSIGTRVAHLELWSYQ